MRVSSMPVKTMTKSELLNRIGGGRGAVSKVAKLLGVSRQAVSDWPEVIPELRLYQLKEKRPELFDECIESAGIANVS